MRQRRASNGAMQVTIGRATVLVHPLVLRAFAGRPTVDDYDHYMPKHCNGDKSDNRYENLAWAMK